MTSVFGDGGVSTASAAVITGRTLQGGYASGKWYPTTEGEITPAAAVAADVLYLYPFRFYSPATVNGLSARVTIVGAGSAMKLVWFAHSSTTGWATGLPVLGNNTSIDTSGSIGYKDSAGLAAVAFVPQILWAGIVMTGTMATFMCNSIGSSVSSAIMGNTGATRPLGTSATTQRPGISIAQPFANDITALNLTGASFTELSGTRIPTQVFSVA